MLKHHFNLLEYGNINEVDMTWDNNKTNFDRNLAIVIGIDRYKSESVQNLRTPVSDARALADLLETEYGYEPKNVRRLFDDAATLTGGTAEILAK